MIVYVDAIRRPDITYVAVDRGRGDVRGFEQSRDFPASLINDARLLSVITWGGGTVICYDETLEILAQLGLEIPRALSAGRQPPTPPCGRTHVSFYAKTRNIGCLKAAYGILEVL